MLAPLKPGGYGSSGSTFYPVVILGANMGSYWDGLPVANKARLCTASYF